MVGEFHLSRTFFAIRLPNILTATQFVLVAVRRETSMLQPTVENVPREPNLVTLCVVFLLPEAPLNIWLHSFDPPLFVSHHFA